MEYVIEIQSVRDRNNKPLPKEIGIVSLQEDVIGHWIISPPCAFDSLPCDIKTANDFISSRMLGIHWFDGFMELNELYFHLQKLAQGAMRIYIHGSENAKFIQ